MNSVQRGLSARIILNDSNVLRKSYINAVRRQIWRCHAQATPNEAGGYSYTTNLLMLHQIGTFAKFVIFPVVALT